jgi:hypothetical protein
LAQAKIQISTGTEIEKKWDSIEIINRIEPTIFHSKDNEMNVP